MTSDLFEAIQRYKSDDYPATDDGLARFSLDEDLICAAYLADRDEREAVEKERALPIDEAWLRTIGGRDDTVTDRETNQLHPVLCIFGSEHIVRIRLTNGAIYVGNCIQSGWRVGTMATTDRGTMLDFLSGLKIPTKAGR